MSPKTTTLDSGLRVVSYEMPQLQTTSLGIWVKAGARNESAAQNGIAHYLEHMAFKGTNRRSALQIAEEIEDVGGEINASTSMEMTAYYARVLKDDAPLAIDILSDIILDPKFDKNELERERGVILQEIAASIDTPDDLVFDLAQRAAYPDHALGRPILGSAEAVKNYNGAAIAAYRDQHYAAPSILVSAAGAIEHERLVDLAHSALSSLPTTAGPKWDGASYEGGVHLVKKPLEQTHVVLCFQAPGYLSKDIYALQVLSGVLGGGMSSRLFQEVREKRGLCYSIFAYASAYEDTGLLNVYAATGPQETGELVDVVSDQLRSIANSVTEEEIKRARAQLKAGLMMSLESSSARANQIARQMMIHNRVVSPEEIIEKIDAVDVSAISKLASGLFERARPSLGAVGDLSGLSPYDDIAAEFA
ncbi:MAG: insulinase family protein [Alphaproteobacteria bacterium]|nr:insulinase family protein [Alphaproteobacteria bacterium]